MLLTGKSGTFEAAQRTAAIPISFAAKAHKMEEPGKKKREKRV